MIIRIVIKFKQSSNKEQFEHFFQVNDEPCFMNKFSFLKFNYAYDFGILTFLPFIDEYLRQNFQYLFDKFRDIESIVFDEIILKELICQI